MRPRFVKKCETSRPFSARRAMVSADTGFVRLLVFFIKLLLLPGCLPESHQVAILSLCVFAHLEDDCVKPVSNPPNGALLFGKSQALIQVIRVRENFQHLFEADPTPGIRPEPLALPLIKMKSHNGITVILHSPTLVALPRRSWSALT